jgi:hypothetical protein
MLRDPAVMFLVVGGIVAVVLAFVRPPFDGIDEPAHFVRAYQISTGRLAPEESADPPGGGACMPRAVLLEFDAARADNLARRLESNGLAPTDVADARLEQGVDRLPRCGRDGRFSDFSSFGWYSPVAYVPAAVGIAVGRTFGAGADVMLQLARLGQIAAYVALGYTAISRAPRGRWALHVCGIVPMALMAASAVSPDALSAAFALLVVSSSLRVTTRSSIGRRTVWLEAVPFALLLAFGKPTYWLVALCYLLPLFAVPRPRGSVMLVAAPVAAALGSTIWQRGTERLFQCDIRFFGQESGHSQVRRLFTAPHEFLGDAARTLYDDGWKWTRQFVAFYRETLGPVPTAVVLLGLVLLACIAAQQGGGMLPQLRRRQRVYLLGVFVLGVVAVLAGFYAYCSAPGELTDGFIGARHFLPLLPVVLVAIGPPSRRWPGIRAQVPIAIVEVVAAGLLVSAAIVYGR